MGIELRGEGQVGTGNAAAGRGALQVPSRSCAGAQARWSEQTTVKEQPVPWLVCWLQPRGGAKGGHELQSAV